MPRGNGTAVGSKMVQDMKAHMTEVDKRTLGAVERETSRMWRTYWIQLAHKHGYSVADIAKEFEISQATVYNTLK